MSKSFCPDCGVLEYDEATGICDYCTQVAENDAAADTMTTDALNDDPGAIADPAAPAAAAPKARVRTRSKSKAKATPAPAAAEGVQ